MRPLFQIIVARGLAPSHGEARRLVRAGRIAVNGVIASDEQALVDDGDPVTLTAPSAGKASD